MDPLSGVKHVLCVRLDTLSGVLLTTPALRALRQSLPGCRLAMLTSASGALAARLIPEIDAVFRYEAVWMKGSRGERPPEAEVQLIEQLRHRGFDAAVIFTRWARDPLPAAMLCYLGGIPRRLAYTRQNPCQLLTDPVAEIASAPDERHEVRRQLDLVAAVGCRTTDERLSLRVPEQVLAEVEGLLRKRGIRDDEPWVVIHPGATAPARRWPSASFAALARMLARHHGCQVVLTGAEADRTLVEGIRAAMDAPSESLVGYLDVAHLAGLLSLAPLLICNDTAPVHLAAAVGTPVVDIYAMTAPDHTPWAVAHRVVSRNVDCKYCYQSVCPQGHGNCLRQIAPEEVLAAVLDLAGEVFPAGHAAAGLRGMHRRTGRRVRDRQ
jgi:lipopolysaccharide heptosyltransferase II